MAGVILGTAAYMSPEQARGLAADRRADIWAFGCVLYEMLTGRQTFEGETVSDTLAAVLKSAPDWTALPSSTPAGVRTLLRRCLEKDPRKRLQAIGDARIAIEETLAPPEAGDDRQEAHATRATGASRPRGREMLAWLATAGLGVVCLALAARTLRPAPASPISMLRVSLNPPPHASFDLLAERSGALSFSPDGRHVTFPLRTADGDKSLWIRSLDSLESRPLPGTRGAGWPFWSPDGQQIAFFAGAKLKRIDLAGSPPITICDAADGRGGDWNRDGVILFSPNANSGIFSVPVSGGSPQQITRLDVAAKETTHRWPMFLPDGRHYLYMAGSHGGELHSEANAIYLGELGKEGRRRVLLARSNFAYDSGHLLYVRDRTLLAQPFDPDRLELTGDPVSISENVAIETNYFRSVFASSRGGSLVFQSASASAGARLTWFGRDGKPIGKAGEISGNLGSSEWLALSPDGKRAAYSQADQESGRANIWISDFERGVRSRLTFEPVSVSYEGLWSPDGQEIVYSVSSMHDDLWVRKATGGDPKVLVHTDADKEATDWSRDGRYLVFDSVDEKVGSTWGIWVVSLGTGDKPRPFVDTEANERGGRFSPDSRWMLYTSDESGRTELYVVPFPGPGGKWQVSSSGALTAWWTQGGKEIVYLGPDLTVMSVPVRSTASAFEADTPRPLFRVPLALAGDVTRDGQRFLMITRPEDEQQEPLTLVTNWSAGLKRP
jgi:eukaryotic-like serine/threonine-protein kinase